MCDFIDDTSDTSQATRRLLEVAVHVSLEILLIALPPNHDVQSERNARCEQ